MEFNPNFENLTPASILGNLAPATPQGWDKVETSTPGGTPAPAPFVQESTAPIAFPTTGRLISTASNQWAKRPADERFVNLAELQDFLTARKVRTKEALKPFANLRIEAVGTDVRLATEKGTALLTHHSFGQLASLAGLQASGLRASFEAFKETAEAAKWVADGLNLGLQGREGDDMANLLLTAQEGQLVARSINTGKYARVWDLDIINRLFQPLQEFGFVNPPAFDGPGGLYASEKDMFAMMVPENVSRVNMRGVTSNICPPKIEVRGQIFSPFIMGQGSEVGGSSQKFMFGLLQAVCANLNMWGCEDISEITVRHTGNPWERIMEAYTGFLNKWVCQDMRKQEDKIAAAMRKILAPTVEEVQEIIARKTTIPQKTIKAATAVVESGNMATGIISQDPTNLWNQIAALTSLARLKFNQDDQVEMVQQAGKLMVLAGR